jgi:transmembrane sensor
MMSSSRNPSGKIESAIREEASRWVVLRDRGFREKEVAQYEAWLRADPRHEAALHQASHSWNLLDKISETTANTILKGSTKERGIGRMIGVSLAAAAALTLLMIGVWWVGSDLNFDSNQKAVATATAEMPKTLILSDKTLVRLNVGAMVEEAFTDGERRVYLKRGEAHFTVTKNPSRPFVVHAGEIVVRAVGTAFNVYMEDQAVDVLVTEGTIQVDTLKSAERRVPSLDDAPGDDVLGEAFLVVEGQRASVAFPSSSNRPPAVFVSAASQGEVSEALAWRDSLLRLGGSSLSELAQDFERKTGRRLVLADSSLADLQIGGRFPSDDIEGFVYLLETNYGIRAEHAETGEIVLSGSAE